MDKLNSLFCTSVHSAVYSKYRFKSPKCITSRILQYLEEEIKAPFKHALDVGCGNGQSTEYLAEKFEQVTGVDISETQIEEAQKRNVYTNITYKVGTASKIPIENDELQLITASQCHHWMELSKFYAEVRRTLVHNGVVCIYWYILPQIVGGDGEKEADRLLKHIYEIEMKEYWDERRQIIDKGFTDLHFPFNNVVKENYSTELEMTVSDVCGYLETWSAYQGMKTAAPQRAESLLKNFRENLVSNVGYGKLDPNKIKLRLEFPYYLIMGRN